MAGKCSLQLLVLLFVISIYVLEATTSNKPSCTICQQLHDFSYDEAVEIVEITKNFMATGKMKKLDRFFHKLRKIVYRRRLGKCIKLLGSENICRNKVRFYIWAQQLAQSIMAGESF